MSPGLRHIYLRKQKQNPALAPYPHTQFWKRMLDRVVLFVALVGPFATVPQIIKIYSHHSAYDLSLLSWLVFALFDIPWIFYGFVHKERPIVIAYVLWFFTNFAVVIGILLYQ